MADKNYKLEKRRNQCAIVDANICHNEPNSVSGIEVEIVSTSIIVKTSVYCKNLCVF